MRPTLATCRRKLHRQKSADRAPAGRCRDRGPQPAEPRETGDRERDGGVASYSSAGVTVVTGRPMPATLLGRSSFSQRETLGERVEMMISSKPRRLIAS